MLTTVTRFNKEKEEYIREINKVKDEVEDMYLELASRKEIAAEDLANMMLTNENLSDRLIDLSRKLDIVNKTQYNIVQMEYKKAAALGFASSVLIFLLPKLGTFTFLYGTVKFIFARVTDMKEIIGKKGELDSLVKTVQDTTNTLDNNLTLILKRSKTLPKAEPSKECVSVIRVVKANDLIENYINGSEIELNKVDSEIKETMIMLLQLSQDTEETDLNTLLKQAKESVQSETINKQLK